MAFKKLSQEKRTEKIMQKAIPSKEGPPAEKKEWFCNANHTESSRTDPLSHSWCAEKKERKEVPSSLPRRVKKTGGETSHRGAERSASSKAFAPGRVTRAVGSERRGTKT